MSFVTLIAKNPRPRIFVPAASNGIIILYAKTLSEIEGCHARPCVAPRSNAALGPAPNKSNIFAGFSM